MMTSSSFYCFPCFLLILHPHYGSAPRQSYDNSDNKGIKAIITHQRPTSHLEFQKKIKLVSEIAQVETDELHISGCLSDLRSWFLIARLCSPALCQYLTLSSGTVRTGKFRGVNDVPQRVQDVVESAFKSCMLLHHPLNSHVFPLRP